MIVEFGRAVAVVTDTGDPVRCASALDKVMENYRKVKVERFPNWDGLMELIVDQDTDWRYVVYGWRADVAEEFVIR